MQGAKVVLHDSCESGGWTTRGGTSETSVSGLPERIPSCIEMDVLTNINFLLLPLSILFYPRSLRFSLVVTVS